MKRFTLLIITLTLTILQIAAQDTSIKGTITLSHQGNETDFAYNEMTKVMDTAADGDTIFLSTGYFQGDFIMTKKIAFIVQSIYGCCRSRHHYDCRFMKFIPRSD